VVPASAADARVSGRSRRWRARIVVVPAGAADDRVGGRSTSIVVVPAGAADVVGRSAGEGCNLNQREYNQVKHGRKGGEVGD